jgi:hypothetical protein
MSKKLSAGERERESRRERENFIRNYPWRIGGGKIMCTRSTEQRKKSERGGPTGAQ